MADSDTDWETLKTRCGEHSADLILRVETMAGGQRFSLAAKDKLGKVLYDARANDEGHAPQYVITTLVSQALEDWWS